ncbi:hypothetical protein TcasGA2_TC000256 [Tribolium castaneum]|uniref:Uncharacterized protein n=1 Tax=Tribolium castaneum TaxID=7070 RepID=D6WBR0_TRICA|nr:hypothetical protein TcasGA2_TC000256 [Tribolium castaneum]
MYLFKFFRKYKNFFINDLERPELVFAVWDKAKYNFYPACIVGGYNKTKKTVPVYFFHNEDEKDVRVDDIIYHHSNLMMVKASFYRRGKTYCGTVYGNDSPKHEGEVRTFFIRLSQNDLVSVPVKYVFLTKQQAQKLLKIRIRKKNKNC